MTRDNRCRKMARSLQDAGWTVIRLGLLTSSAQPQSESDVAGAIYRVRTTERFAADRIEAGDLPAPDPGAVAPARASTKGAIRDALGRYRDCVLFAQEIEKRAPSVVIVQNPDLGPLVPMLRRRGVPVVWEALEIWTEMEPRAHRMYKLLFGRFERMAWRSASERTAVNEYVGKELARRHGELPFSAIHNGSDRCREAVSAPSQPVRLFFQGAFEANRDLDILVQAMVGLRGKATLTLQGFGVMERALRDLVDELALQETVRFIEPCAPSDVVESAAGYDVGIVSYRATSMNLLYSSPNKFFDYLGGSLALAVGEIPFMADAVRRFECGVVLDTSSPESLGAGLAEMISDRESLSRMKRGALAACREYAWDRQAETLIKMCERLVAAQGVPK